MKAMKALSLKRGVTLIELLVAISILGIVVGIAIPAFTNLIENHSISNVANDLIVSLNMARSEAVKRDLPVSVCATLDSNYSACGSNWNLGWMVFVNPTGGTTLSNTAAAPLMRVQKNTDTNLNITRAPAANIITYAGTGFPAAGSANVVFTVKATGCTSDAGRTVTVSFTGNPTMATVTCP